jgi:aldose 1-epimerase
VIVIAALSLLGSVFLAGTAQGIALFMVFGMGLTAGLLGQIGRALGSEALKTIAHSISWALPFDRKLHLAARVADPTSGRVMDVLTTEPSIHVYTAGYMSGKDIGAQGVPYRAFDAVALEAQHFQDTPHRPEFPITLLKPGQVYRATTIYRFSVR